MEEIKILTGVPEEVLCEAFVEAFSDYQVKMDFPLWKFQGMLKRRGFNRDFSMGYFSEGKLVGFIFNGYREYRGRKTVYDLGTAVLPGYRNKGITSRVFKEVNELLKEKAVEVYLLEVIQSNTPAVELYKKNGFKVTRSFNCLNYNKEKGIIFKNREGINLKTLEITEETLMALSYFWDFYPSWQNSIASVLAYKEAFQGVIAIEEGEIVGYGIIDTKTGDIPQLAVDKTKRGQGIGTAILGYLKDHTDSKGMAMLNIEEGASYLEGFLISMGFESGVTQYEMILDK
ncbi:GNAT family N-acetyltransferase [Alloiococcus sp. CFN-8]|uniref:GNAT family N-acetyltransferase n=1 Tax=Alloiococcus sp. CFN-8 TaxID=3416081 RepID=UPI003CE7CA28